MDSEILTLQVDINDNPLNEKVDSIEKKITTLKEKAGTMLSTGDTTAVPGFLEDTASLWKTLQNNLDSIVKTRKSIDHAANAYEQESLIHSYKRQVEAANRSLTSLFQTTDLAKGLSEALGKELSAAFSHSVQTVAPSFAEGLRASAKTLAQSAGGAIQSDSRIVDHFMTQGGYRTLVSRLQKEDPKLYSDNNMRKYLGSMMGTAVPQYWRGDVSGKSAIPNRSQPESFRGALPAAFQKISTNQAENIRDINTLKKELLTVEEKDKLYRMVRNERFAADNAMKAGIVGKRNGELFFNPNTTREMVNAMAGFAMQDAVVGAKGEKKYGIRDVESAKAWENIQKKNNTYWTGGLSTMRSMQDAFGEWLDPGYYKGLTPFEVISNSKGSNGVNLGKIKHNPKVGSRAFAEYTLDMMDQGWQINGENPIINGKVLTSVTAPMKSGSSENPLRNRAITPDDWHTITLRESLLQDILEGSSAAVRTNHNDFSPNAIYMKLDKRMADPYVSDETEKEIVERYAERFEKGYTVNGVHNSFTRANKTHAEFVPDPILEDLGRKRKAAGEYQGFSDLKAGLAYLRGGVGLSDYETYEQFAKDQNVANTMATEGENLFTYMGVKNPKVVVGNFSYTDENGRKHKLLDGQNIISSRISSQGFQGRGYGDKATFSVADFAGYRALHPDLVYKNDDTEQRIREAEIQKGRALTEDEKKRIVQTYGDLVIPGAGVDGGSLVVPWDTDIIEDISNIKSYQTGLKGLSQSELNAARSKAYAEHGLYAKTTYDQANTSSRWISHQLVSAMNGGFNDPEVGQYFQKVFNDEIARLGDEQYVRQALFGGDQDVDLTSKESQDVILNYQNQLFRRWNANDRLVPAGTFHYQMAGANFANVLNELKTRAGFNLTEDQKLAATPADAVMSLDSLAEMLGVVRFPATGEGNQTAVNMAADPKVGKKVRKLAAQLGMDPKALYFNPESPMLKAMQGEDFDGDLNGIFELARSSNPEFSNIMQKVFKLSQESYANWMAASNRTEEQQEAIRAKQTKAVETRESHPEKYSPENMMDVARNVAAGQKVPSYMGTSSGLLFDAWQHPITETIARAVRDSSDMSDVMSVANKKGEIYKQTNDQWALKNAGSEFGRIFNWASKAVHTEGENDNSVLSWTGESQDAFNKRAIDELNLPSMNVRSTFDTLVERFVQKRKGMPVDLADADGNRIFNWDVIFDGLDKSKPADEKTWTGKMTKRLRDIKKDILNADYLLPSEEAVAEIQKLQDYSYQEIQDQVRKEGLDPTRGKGYYEVEKRFRKAGGQVARNITAENGMVMTRERAMADPYYADTIGQLQGLYPNQNLFGSAAGYNFINNDVQAEAAEKANEARRERIKTLKEEVAAAKEARKVELSVGGTVPPIKKTEFTATEASTPAGVSDTVSSMAEEMVQAKTKAQEVEEILKAAGMRQQQINKLLKLPQNALRDAVVNQDANILTAFNGIGMPTAKLAVEALTGSSFHRASDNHLDTNKPIETVKAPVIVNANEAVVNETAGPTKTSSQIETKQAEIKKLEAEIADTENSINAYNQEKKLQPEKFEALTEFSDLMSGARDFSTGLWSHMRKTQNQLKDIPFSMIELDKNRGIAASYTRRLQNFKDSAAYQWLSPDQRSQLDRMLEGPNSLNNNVLRDFGESNVLRAGDLVENLNKNIAKANGDYSPQIESLNQWQEKIKSVQAAQEELLRMASSDEYTDEQRKNFKDWANDIGANIDKAKDKTEQLKKAFTDQNEKQIDKQISGMEDRFFYGNKNKLLSQKYAESIGEMRSTLTKNHDNGLITDSAFEKDMGRLDELERKSTTTALTMREAFDKVGKTVSSALSRFGRQMFHKALQEARKFVTDFDKAMTEIQMITLKTDDQINQLGSHLIQTALDSGTTVSDVTSAASNLYRQGLSDEEVDERLDDVLKFAKVAGIKTDEASKIITTALQNNLVGSSEEAMDALVALGDTAATTASEIAKGMQKSAASAKQAGMSYGELVTLLTIGTSKTQLGGSSLGSAVQTLMYRLYKINSGEDFYDENGNHIAATAATEAIGRMGVDMFENGAFRGPYQILQDIAANWENADDITQSAILSTLGAGRQRSNVATLIQGLAEDNGEIAGRYLNTAENSRGITDQKYQAYLDSLEAKINQTKTSWDQLVNAFNINGVGSGMMESITGIIQGLTALVDTAGSAVIVLPLLASAFLGLTAAMKTNPMLKYIGLGIAAVGAIGAISNYQDTQKRINSPAYQLQQSSERESSTVQLLQKDIDRARELYSIAEKKGGDVSSLSEAQQTELSSILTRLGNEFGNASNAAKDLAGNFSNVGAELDGYQKQLNEYSLAATRRAVSNLPVTNNINDLIKETPSGDLITPAAVEGIAGFRSGVRSVRVTSNLSSDEEALRYSFPAGKSFDEKILPLATRLFLEGRTGAVVGSMDDYYRLLGEKSDEGKNARQTLLDEMDATINGGYGGTEQDYKKYLTEIVTSYAEKTLQSALSTNGALNADQVDAVVSTFISNVLSVFADYNPDNIEDLNIGAIVSEEIQKINDALSSENLSEGINSYTGLNKTLQERADVILANEDSYAAVLDYLTEQRLAGSTKKTTEKTFVMPDGRVVKWTGDQMPEEVQAESFKRYQQENPLTEGTRPETADEILADPNRKQNLRTAAEAEFKKKYGNLVENSSWVYNDSYYDTFESAYAAALNDYLAKNATRGENKIGSRADAAKRFLETHPDVKVSTSEPLMSWDAVADWLENSGYYLNNESTPFVEYKGKQYSQAEWNETQPYLYDFNRNGPYFSKETVYQTESGSVYDTSELSAAQAAYDAELERYVQDKLSDASWVVEQAANEISTATYGEQSASGKEEIEKLRRLQKTEWQTNPTGVMLYSESEAIQRARAEDKAREDLNDPQKVLDAAKALGLSTEESSAEPAGPDFWEAVSSARDKYQQDNANALAADRVFKAVSSGGIESFEEFIEAFNNGDIQDLSNVLYAFPELADTIFSFAEETEDGKLKLKDGVNDTGNAFAEFVAALAGVTKNFTEFGELTREQVANNATDFLANPTTSAFKNEYQSIVGTGLTAKTVNGTMSDLETSYVNDLIANYRIGRNGLTGQQQITGAQTIFDMINNGQLDKLANADEGMLQAYMSNAGDLDEYFRTAREVGYEGGDWSEYEEQLRETGKTAEYMTEKQKEINRTLQDGKTKLSAAGEYANDYAASLESIRKGGKSATQELAKMFSKTLSLEDQITAAQKARGKTGKGLDSNTKDFVSQFLGIDKKDVDKMTKEQISDIADTMEKSANEEFSQTNFASMLTGAFEDINTAIGENKITLDQVVDVVTTANTTGDMSGFVQLLNDIQSQYASVAESFSGHILSYFISVVQALGQNSGKVDVDASVQKSKASLKGAGVTGKYNRASGGGGGGKSAAQKAIETSKREISQAQHEVNMAEADLYHPDKVNDYSGYNSAIQANINAYNKLDAAYAKTISDLEAQRGAVKADSDDWWSLTDAINSNIEARRKLEQTIDDLNRKLFEETKEQNGYKIATQQHEVNMADIDRTHYSRVNDYDNEINAIDRQIAGNEKLAETYREVLDEYTRLRDEEYAKNGESDYWNELNQEIQSVNESLGQLKNTNASLNAEKLNTILEQQENEDKPENHAYAMMDLYKSRYLDTESYEAFDQIMEQRQKLISDTITSNNSQIQKLEGLLSEYEVGSDEWIATRDAIWAIKYDTAQKENEAIQNEKEIAEQRLARIAQTYERDTALSDHQLTQQQTYAQMYQRNGDYAGYQNELSNQIGSYERIIESTTKARDAAVKDLATLDKESPEWYKQIKAVYEYDEAIASATASIQENNYAIEESKANSLLEDYNTSMALFDQQLKLTQDEKKKYNNNNDYAGYMGALSRENQIASDQQTKRQEYLVKLQERLANTTINTDAWKNLRKEIYSVEQAISAADVTLENFENELAKTRIDYFLEKMDRAQGERTHAITMIQYEETRYQNADELSNYVIMLGKENEAREQNVAMLQRDIQVLEKELDNLEEGSKQYERVTDAIKKKEEAIAADSNAIQKNNKLIEENNNKIIQQRKALEDQVEAEIKKRIAQEKSQLSAEVNLQNQILDSIKERYRDEWELQRKDIEKKKEALNEEKNLLNERLNARKKAIDAEDKYEELSELQKQLAIISNDPTRTKDAKTLRNKISDLQKDISWDRATEEVESENERIDNEIASLDDYVSINEENLNYMLEDAHNFSDEVYAVLGGTYEEIVAWMMQNNTDFKNSLDETQQVMINNWEDTWKAMHGIVDTYWSQINDIMRNKDTFLSFMKESTDYINASAAGQAGMEYSWGSGYDRMVNSQKVDQNAVNYQPHSHETDAVNSVVNQLNNVSTTGKTYDNSWASKGVTQNTIQTDIKDYTGIGQTPKSKTTASDVPSTESFKDTYTNTGTATGTTTKTAATTTSASTKSGWQKENGSWYYYENGSPFKASSWDKEWKKIGDQWYVFDKSGKMLTGWQANKDNLWYYHGGAEDGDMKHGWIQDGNDWYYTNSDGWMVTGDWTVDGKTEQFDSHGVWQGTKGAASSSSSSLAGKFGWDVSFDSKSNKWKAVLKEGATMKKDEAEKKASSLNKNYSSTAQFASGGLVDFTGPAWVDGTKSKPEAFLSAVDTENIRKMLDAFNYVRVSTGILPSASMFSGSSQTIGDIHITINQAELKSDADFDDVARRVGRSFVKEISHQGISLAGYAF